MIIRITFNSRALCSFGLAAELKNRREAAPKQFWRVNYL
jgi:hypothetical protein